MARKKGWTAEQDAFLRQYGPTQSCAWMAEQLHRSTASVHARAKKIGVDMTKRGEAHWRAKANVELADMIGALADAGFRPVQIHALVTTPMDLSTRAVEDICAGRTWRGEV